MSDPFSPQEKIGNYTELREAADNLSMYVSYATRDKIAGTILKQTSVVPNMNSKSAAAQSKFIEQLVGSSEPVPLYDIVLKEITDNKYTSLYTYRFDTDDAGGPDIIAGLGIRLPAAKILSSRVFDLAKDRKITAVYHTATEFADISSLLSDISAMFCNIVPPTELSLCVPYFDVNIIYPKKQISGRSSDDSIGSLSLTSHLGDNRTEYRALGSKLGYDVAGMEIFSVPQALGPSTDFLNNPIAVSKRGVRVLDPISPLMTIESANIQQLGIGGSLYAQTKIDLKLSLHDRSRLAEIEELVTAQSFPNVTLRITYGWHHPHSNKMSGNVYAKLINAMRITQDFVVSSVSIGSKETIGLSITLSLVSAGSQAASSAKVISGLGKYVPYSVLQPLIKEAVSFRTSNSKNAVKFSAVGSTIVSSTSSGTSGNKFIEAKKFYEFRKLLRSVTDPTNYALESVKIQEVADALNNIEISGKKDSDLGYTDLFRFPDETFYASYYSPISSQSSDGYINDMDDVMESLQIKTPQYNGRPPAIPLAVAIARFIASPLLVSQPDIDEVRIHMYSFNQTAGKQAGKSIGDFPIILKDLIEATDAKSNKVTKVVSGRTSVEQMIKLLVGQINKASSPFYGHTQDYDKKKQISEAAAKDAESLAEVGDEEEIKQVQDKTDQALADVARDTTSRNAEFMKSRGIKSLEDTKFRPPRVKIQIDVVPAYGPGEDRTKPTKRVARLHVYDERAGNVGKKANFLVALLNSQTGIAAAGQDTALPDEIERIVTKIVKKKGGKKNTDSYYAIKDKEAARRFISDSYPTLIIGSDSGIITNASFTSQPSGEVASAYLLTALEEGTTTDTSGASVEGDIVDDILITPTTVTLSMLGNVLVTRGQTYYVDFNTGTTLDNTYTVTSVSHSIKPGGFTTSVTLAPVFSATMKSASRQISEIVSLLDTKAT